MVKTTAIGICAALAALMAASAPTLEGAISEREV